MTRRIKTIVNTLSREYGDPRLNNLSNPIDEIIFVFLSEKTDESKYIEAYQRLRSRFPSWEEIVTAEEKDIEAAIRCAGMGRRRAVLLKKLLQSIVVKFGALDLSRLRSMPMNRAEEELLRLPGIGRKSARCVLLYCFDFQTLIVDVHTYRLAVRLGIIPRSVSYDRAHLALPLHVPPQLRKPFHLNAVAHGRQRCFARTPRCEGCPLARFCLQCASSAPAKITLRPKPLVIDLFAGAGGLTLGFKRAGFHIAQAIEKDPKAAMTYHQNNPEVDCLGADIKDLDPTLCLQRIGLRSGDVDVLIGGPPCQGFSESNRRTRTLKNPSNHLYKQFFRFLKEMRPAWFLLENVAGLRTLAGGAVLKRILNGCRRFGYCSEFRELMAADYGVPQYRRRLFIVGNRTGQAITFPNPKKGDDIRLTTVRDAISDLPRLENGAVTDCLPYPQVQTPLSEYQQVLGRNNEKQKVVQGNLVTRNSDMIIKRYHYIGEGENWEVIPASLLDNYADFSRCHTGIYYRLEWDNPSKVIGNFRKNMLIHPDQHRGLSIREAARLQSFPDHYVFVGSIGFQQQQVADAVPPLLAEAVARCIMDRLTAKGTRNP
jgi:DNA (cytosine-5)-methyltransferase 1